MHPFDALEVSHGRVGIHWFGQSSFAFKDSEGMVTQVDPYFPEERPPERFIHSESPVDETTLRTDFVLLTHDHGDHTCMESLLRIHEAFPEVRFVGPAESIMRMDDGGIPDRLMTEVTAVRPRRLLR
jgi:L-ascorbate metabolism protein UlaG (beta-lactamase superfamily)